MLPLIARRNLPPPLFNASVRITDGRIEVDFLWPDQRFVLEADSRDFHGTAVAFERDRWRDRELLRAGYSVPASPAARRNAKPRRWPPPLLLV